MKQVTFALLASFFLSSCANQATLLDGNLKHYSASNQGSEIYSNENLGISIKYDSEWTLLEGDRNSRKHSANLVDDLDSKNSNRIINGREGISISFFRYSLNEDSFDNKPSLRFRVENIRKYQPAINSGADFLKLLEYHLTEGGFAHLDYAVSDITTRRVGETEYYALHASMGAEGYVTQRLSLVKKIGNDYIVSMVLTYANDAEKEQILSLVNGVSLEDVDLAIDPSIQAKISINKQPPTSL